MTTATTAEKIYTGGCLCGSIRYTATGPTDDFPHLCSCEHCKKRSGGPVMAWAGFYLINFAWDGPGGEPTWFETHPRKTKRGFCPVCGTHVAGIDIDEPVTAKTIMGVLVPSLDDPEQPEFAPIHQGSAKHAFSWMPPIPSQIEPEPAPAAQPSTV
jgi:hypothetical protein